MTENRNTLRIWSDRIHRVLGVITTAAVIWIFTQAHVADKNDAVFMETLENINKTLSQHETRLSVIEQIRIELARSHYTKPEVESLVDRSIRPLQKDVNRVEESTRRVERKVDKILDMVKK